MRDDLRTYVVDHFGDSASGILWVLRTRSSWRGLPLEFGKWETAYKRWRLWQDTGLWQRLLALLGDEVKEGPLK